jgi:hypothetical protein
MINCTILCYIFVYMIELVLLDAKKLRFILSKKIVL